MAPQDWSKLSPRCRAAGRALNQDLREFLQSLQELDPLSDICSEWQTVKTADLSSYINYLDLQSVSHLE